MIGQYFFVGGIAGVVISLLLLLIFKGVFKKEEKRLLETIWKEYLVDFEWKRSRLSEIWFACQEPAERKTVFAIFCIDKYIDQYEEE